MLASAENHLIEMLPRKDRARLLELCEKVPLLLADVLVQPGLPMLHAYFPIAGVISVVTHGAEHQGLEVGMVGREGMLGATLSLGAVTAPLRALVQAPGMAWRIGGAALRAELLHSKALQEGMNRYLCVLMDQMAASAACLRFHLIGPRLARWLLMSHDRVQADHFRVTHQVLAGMLGVRRVGITSAAGGLQRGGLIEYHRGEITVLNRCGLEGAACTCYAADRQAYRDLVG